MAILEMKEEYSSENIMDDARSITEFKHMCALMGARLIPFRDSVSCEICTPDSNGKRGWKIKGRVEITRTV